MKASMANDLEAGNRLELDWLAGKVVALGRRYGMATPAHEAVYAILKPYRMGRPRVSGRFGSSRDRVTANILSVLLQTGCNLAPHTRHHPHRLPGQRQDHAAQPRAARSGDGEHGGGDQRIRRDRSRSRARGAERRHHHGAGERLPVLHRVRRSRDHPEQSLSRARGRRDSPFRSRGDRNLRAWPIRRRCSRLSCRTRRSPGSIASARWSRPSMR